MIKRCTNTLQLVTINVLINAVLKAEGRETHPLLVWEWGLWWPAQTRRRRSPQSQGSKRNGSRLPPPLLLGFLHCWKGFGSQPGSDKKERGERLEHAAMEQSQRERQHFIPRQTRYCFPRSTPKQDEAQFPSRNKEKGKKVAEILLVGKNSNTISLQQIKTISANPVTKKVLQIWRETCFISTEISNSISIFPCFSQS